jgi:hypothetical protein
MYLPFEKSYWAIPGKVLAGCYPGSKDEDDKALRLNNLLSLSISLAINLMEPNEIDLNGDLFDPYENDLVALAKSNGRQMECFRVPIRDMHIPSKKQMVEILDLIDQAFTEERSVYVHCWGGRGRTGTVIGCYLIRHGISAYENVLADIETLRSKGIGIIGRSPETMEQKAFVLSWGKDGLI